MELRSLSRWPSTARSKKLGTPYGGAPICHFSGSRRNVANRPSKARINRKILLLLATLNFILYFSQNSPSKGRQGLRPTLPSNLDISGNFFQSSRSVYLVSINSRKTHFFCGSLSAKFYIQKHQNLAYLAAKTSLTNPCSLYYFSSSQIFYKGRKPCCLFSLGFRPQIFYIEKLALVRSMEVICSRMKLCAFQEKRSK